MGLGLRIASAKHAGLAFASLLALASPTYAACSSVAVPSLINTDNTYTADGDTAFIVNSPIGGNGLYFDNMAGGPLDSLAVTNGQAIDNTGSVYSGIEISGDFATICYDGLASGSIKSDNTGFLVDENSDGDVLLNIAHGIDAGYAGIDVRHYGDGLVDITSSTITAGGTLEAGISVMRLGQGNTNITANGAINAAAGPGITVSIDEFGGDGGDVDIKTNADITSANAGIAVAHYGDAGDIKITTSSGTTISVHGGSGVDYWALPLLSGTAGIYVDRAAIGLGGGTGDITVTNGADIDVESVGIYVDVCNCVDSNILVNSTGKIDVDEGFGIYVTHDTGNTSVNQSGKVTVLDGTGLAIEQLDDGDVVAGLTGGVEATDGGILVEHEGDGDITVNAAGAYDIDNGGGIEVSHLGDGTIGVTSSAAIDSEFDAMWIEHLGTGSVTVASTGKLTVNNGAGIWIDKFGDGNVGVSASGGIEATDGGIVVEHSGAAGTVTVTTAAGDTISAHGGIGPYFSGPVGIYVDRYNAGLGTGTGGITITNGAAIDAESLGIFASLCVCVEGDLSITSTGAIDVDGLFGAGIVALHDGEGTASVNASGRITVTDGTGISVVKSGDGAIDVTAGAISAALAGISVISVDDADITVAANGKITATDGLGIVAGSFGAGAIGITTAADIAAFDAAIVVTQLGVDDGVTIVTSGGKLTASGSTSLVYFGTAATGSAGIMVIQGGAGRVSITSGSAIEVDGVGIYVEACGCMSSAVSIASSANITAPYGIIASTTGAATLNQSAGTITGTQGVTLTGSTIAATIAAGAKIAVNGTGAGRYGLTLDGTSEVTIAGTINALGSDALLLTGGNAKLTLLPGFVINGQVDALDTATNELIFGGSSGAASFDLDRLGTNITDFDSFLKTGNSTWTFSGASFAGLLTAKAGTVVINSNIPGLDLVLENTILHGNAGLKSLTTTGGTLAPGNSIGTITVAGNATIGAGTVYGVELNAAGASDKLIAGGTVSIDPTASVLASMEPGSFGVVTKYTIITGAAAVSGAFNGVNSVSAFYDAQLTYDANNAYLTLTRNALTLGDFANTPNQQATAAALDGGGQGVPYFSELFVLPAGEVAGALDAISGDGYASLAAAALDNGRFVRDAALDRRGARGIWTTPYGGLSHLPGDGNGPAVDHATGGLLLGADREVGDGYLGLLLGYGRTSYAIPSRDMSAASGEFSLGTYGGVDWDGFYASFGGTLTARSIDATRQVVFTGVSDSFTAQYASLTAQAFTELGFRLELGSTTITPFGGLAGLQSASTGYTETGSGAGALTVGPGTSSALVATLGVRLEHEMALNDDTTLTLRGAAAWRHSIGKASTSNSMAGTAPFTVAGTPLAADTLTVSAGTALDMGQLSVGLDYTGAFGSGGIANAATATLAGKF